ncbi:hypothetical protein BZA77DRAFT_386241 [Pyronema omphalodes]|nr:hypothetical protein BZA77DRAFT_386241 [Pyronema omphalodes]
MMSDLNNFAASTVTTSYTGISTTEIETVVHRSKSNSFELPAAAAAAPGSAPTPPDSPPTTSTDDFASTSFTAEDITAALTSDLLIQQPPHTAETFRALCPLCSIRKPIYCCPRCFQRTCSVTCYKKHKLRELCNGIRDPAAFVKRSALMNEGALNRDYAFLTGLERGVMTAPLLEVGAAQEGGNGKEKVEKVEATEAGVGETGGQQDHERRKLEKMLKDRGIEIKFAPWRGFGRAKENKTRAVARKNNRAAHLAFTINFQLMSDPSDDASVTNTPVSNELVHNVSEHTSIIESYFNTRSTSKKPTYSTNSTNLSSANPAQPTQPTEPTEPTEPTIPTSTSPKKPTKTEKHKTEFYLVLQAPGGKKCCTKLDKLKDWKWNLRGRTVVEYPDVLVVTSKEEGGDGERMLQGWEVRRDERPIVEVKEEEEEGRKKVVEKEPVKKEEDAADGADGAGIVDVSAEGMVPVVTTETAIPLTSELATQQSTLITPTPTSTSAPTTEPPKITTTHGGLLEPASNKRKHQEDDDLVTTIGAIKKARSSELAF